MIGSLLRWKPYSKGGAKADAPVAERDILRGLLTAFQTRQYLDQLEKATEIYHKGEHVLLNQADG